jgi:hypothetical protein
MSINLDDCNLKKNSTQKYLVILAVLLLVLPLFSVDSKASNDTNLPHIPISNPIQPFQSSITSQSANTWETGVDLNIPKFEQAVSLNNKIYFFTDSTSYMLDLSTDALINMPPSPTTFSVANPIVILQNKIYVLCYNELFELDPNSYVWTMKNPP